MNYQTALQPGAIIAIPFGIAIVFFQGGFWPCIGITTYN